LRVGNYLMTELTEMKGCFASIVDVRGCGLLVAMEFDTDLAEALVLACMQRGLLLNRVKPNAIRFLPPLIVMEKEVDEALSILREALQDLGG
ncbi:MAG: aminotransferase class III-fold pyridoxal phosphate-dependent enzyme, partial [Dehalococcoidia bacterium]|nr:aminotransferase class III-fold pyridoxal phosphate-dependent enzyme [Dehalococcoidia bacterium]